MQQISYTKVHAPVNMGPVVFSALGMLFVAAILLFVSAGRSFLGWTLVAIDALAVIGIVRTVLDPNRNEVQIVTDGQNISVRLPGQGAHVIPIDRIFRIVGIAHEWGLAHGGDEVDFEIYWDAKKIRISEEILLESGLRKLLCELPLFNRSLLQEAQLAALHGDVPLRGKRYSLLENTLKET